MCEGNLYPLPKPPSVPVSYINKYRVKNELNYYGLNTKPNEVEQCLKNKKAIYTSVCDCGRMKDYFKDKGEISAYISFSYILFDLMSFNFGVNIFFCSFSSLYA